MDEQMIQQAAEALRDARVNRCRLEALPEACRPTSIAEAYAIQDRLFSLLEGDFYGWKIGATSTRARELVGVTSPICARLKSTNAYVSPGDLSAHFFFMRAVESEFAFRLRTDLLGDDGKYHAENVSRAIESLHPAIEVSDSRYNDWTRSGGASLIADNSNDGAFVLGPSVDDWRSVDLDTHAVSLYDAGKCVAEGGGHEVMDGPLGALAWLANECVAKKDPLRAGQIITTGSCTGVYVAPPGSNIVADFGALGRVVVQF